jgi:hypothetical protein
VSKFLSSSEVSELTGRKFKSRQIDALRKMGIAFYVNATGHPVVLCSAIEGKSEVKAEPKKEAWVPRVLKAV